jgi:hypothetical protein
MSNKNRYIQRIGIWLILPAFVLVAVLLPAAGLPAILAEAVELIISLEIVSVLSFAPNRRLRPALHSAIRPRSPPIY